MEELFPPEFVAAVSQLRLRAGSVPRGGRHGEHGSAQMGAGMEFRDYRGYLPGDDLRRIDWNLYQRSGSLFLRLFEEERNLPVYVLLDCSDSMFFEDPPRANAAKQAAAVVIAAALNQQDEPRLYSFGSDLRRHQLSISSRRALPAVMEELSRLGAAGETNLPRVLSKFGALRQRKGMLVIVSDFFDPGGIKVLAESLHGMAHKLLLVRLAKEGDAKPDLEGELLIEDCESGGDLRITVTKEAIEGYEKAFGEFEEGLLEFSNQRQAGYVRLDADGDVLDQFIEIFNDGVIQSHG